MKFINTLLLCMFFAGTLFGQVKLTPNASPSSITNYAVPSRTIIDTTSTRWQKVADGYIDSEMDLGIDRQGRIFAILRDKADKKAQTLAILESGKWKPVLKPTFNEALYHFLMDGIGGLYLMTEKGVYHSIAKGWQLLDCPDENVEFKKVPGRDGNLYALKKDTAKPYAAKEIMVWKKNCWSSVEGHDSGLVMPVGYREFAVDGKGHVYCWETIPYQATNYVQTIQLWDGREWKKIAEPQIKIYGVGIDKAGRFFAQGFRGEYPTKYFFGFWDGQKWADAPRPPDALTNFVIKLRTNNGGSLFMQFHDKTTKSMLYLSDTNQYVLIAEEDGSSASNLIPLGDDVYKIDRVSNNLFKYNHISQAKGTSLTTIPIEMGVDSSEYLANWLLKNAFIVTENGKVGLQDIKGTEIAKPIFDEISFAPAPTIPPYSGLGQPRPNTSEKSAICLRRGNEKIFVTYHSYVNLRGYWEVIIPCEKCSGRGHERDKVERKEVAGEWVKGESSTSTTSNYERVWDPKTNSYKGVSTKTTSNSSTPGYRKPSTYRSETISGATCSWCKGKGTESKIDHYFYDKVTKTYTMKWY